MASGKPAGSEKWIAGQLMPAHKVVWGQLHQRQRNSPNPVRVLMVAGFVSSADATAARAATASSNTQVQRAICSKTAAAPERVSHSSVSRSAAAGCKAKASAHPQAHGRLQRQTTIPCLMFELEVLKEGRHSGVENQSWPTGRDRRLEADCLLFELQKT